MRYGISKGVLRALDLVRDRSTPPAPVTRNPEEQRAFMCRVSKRRKAKGYAVHKSYCKDPKCPKCVG